MNELPFTQISNLELILGIISFIIITTLALAVYFKNPKSWTNRFFVILSILLDIYIIVNAFALHPLVPTFENQLFWIRFDMLLGAFASPTLLLLAHTFPKKEISMPKKYLRPLLISTVICAIISFTPFVFTSVSYPNGSTTPVPHPGLAIPFYFLHFVGLFILSFFVMFKSYKKALGIDKIRTLYLLIGSIGTFSLLAIFIFLFTVIWGNTKSVFLGPIFPVILMSSIGYSIIKHKFLDIQPIIARTISYIFLIAFLAIIYAFLLFYGANQFLGEKLNLGVIIINAILAVIIILTFQPLHKIIQRITDRFFFKGLYNSDKILSDLTHTITSTINLNELANKLLETIDKELRVSKSMLLTVKNEELSIVKSINYENSNYFQGNEFKEFLSWSKSSNLRFFTIDDIGVNKYKDIFRNYEIEAIFPINADKKLVAILILGTKLSGMPYSTQDLNLLDIFASESGIAIANARLYTDLQNALEAKSKFISVTSHQLRTPINGIKWGLTELKESNEVKENKKILEQSYERTIFLGEQLDDILTALDIYNQKIQIKKEICDIKTICEEIIREYQSTLTNNNISIIYDIKNEAENVNADFSKIRKIIRIIIKNAILYSNNGQTITISSYLKQDKNIQNTVISVSDQGIGMTEMDMNHAFDEFFRSDRARLKLPDGLGLGMFIAKAFSKAQDGEINISSSGIDKGCTISVLLPN